MIGWLNNLNPFEVIAVLCSVLYVILAAKENILCWLFALISTAIYTWLYWNVSLFMESALNVYYLAMAVYGWWKWNQPSNNLESAAIKSWPISHILKSIAAIVVVSLISGWLLTNNTRAALPYLDSFTTWAAVFTTWMVAQKILQNWLYWIVINSVGVYLNVVRDLELTAILIGFYIVMSVYGYYLWNKKYQASQH